MAEPAAFANPVRFGDDFELDPRAYELRRAGRPLKLERIPMELLLLLIERRGQLVTRDQIILKIWGKDVYLDADTSINSAIRKIRQVLKDGPEQPRFLQTVTGRGYRFIGAVTELEPASPPAQVTVQAQPENFVGQTISHYRILSLLGSGGMGVVYEGEDLRLGRHVALKLLPEKLLKDSRPLQRFDREARAASSLNHPNICTIYEVEEYKQQPVIVMELLEGESLKERIRKGPVPYDELLDIGIQIAGALKAAHAKGIIHRDIKPGNIFIVNDWRVKILDFGLAKLLPVQAAEDKSDQDSLTLEGVIPGTTPYMSPEQIRDEEIDLRSDLFSLGVVLYEMATGKKPFVAKNRTLTMNAILNEKPAAATKINPHLPAGMDAILSKSLAKERTQRYQQAAEMIDDLNQLKAVPGAVPAPFLPNQLAYDSRRKSKISSATLWLGGVFTLAVLLVLVIGGQHWFLRRANFVPPRSIAVLPLENLTGDSSQQYFTDGMTDALITNLAQIGSLRVTSRTSTMQYQGSKKPLTVIARELGVDAILEGSVARSGNRVRIDAQLIQGVTDRHLWARSYDRDIQDVLALQNEIARTVASEVQVELTPREHDRLSAGGPVNRDAYEAYLRGRFFWNKRNKEAIDKSIHYFNEAIRIDPGYAAAYSGLAEAYYVAGCGRPGGLSLADMGPRARAAALRAVELDDNSAEAHAALGAEKQCYERDLSGAEGEFKRAIALNPNYDVARNWYSGLLLRMGRNQDALDQIQQALRLDPVSPNINGKLGDYLIQTRQFDKAIGQLQKTVELEPDQYNSRVRLGFAYTLVHRNIDAEREFKKAEEISPDSLISVGALAYVYALEGRTVEAERMLPPLEVRSLRAGHPWVVCLVYIGLNRKDDAFRWLQKAYEQGDFFFDLESPLLDPLRSDFRFQDLEQNVKVAIQRATPP